MSTLVHLFNIALAQWIFPPSLSLSCLPSFLSTLPPLPLYIIFYVFVTFPSCLPSFFAFIHTLHLLRFLFIPSNFSSCFFSFYPLPLFLSSYHSLVHFLFLLLLPPPFFLIFFPALHLFPDVILPFHQFFQRSSLYLTSNLFFPLFCFLP